MKKLKCPHCGKTLLMIDYGKLEIKCSRCGQIVNIEIKITSNEQSPR